MSVPRRPPKPQAIRKAHIPPGYDPACYEAYTQAIRYIGTLTQDWTLEQFHMLFHEPFFRVHEENIMAACKAGDLETTRGACRAWWGWITEASLASASQPEETLA